MLAFHAAMAPRTRNHRPPVHGPIAAEARPLAVLHKLRRRRSAGGAVPGAGAPPGLAPFRDPVDGVVVGILAAEREWVLGFHPGSVVLRPVRSPYIGGVAGNLMPPPLADIGDVTDHPGGGEAGQVAHDLVLEVLRLGQGKPPVLAAGD